VGAVGRPRPNGQPRSALPLNNDGDEVLLIDGRNVVRSQVAYGKKEVRSGQWVHVARPRAETSPTKSGDTRQK